MRINQIIHRYSFKPGLIPTMVTIVLLPCLIGLGFWQLQRAEQKRQLIKLYETRLQQPAQILSKVALQPNKLDFLAIEVQGTFINDKNLLLTNKYHNHLLGYQVITPFRLKATGRTILINRGWIPKVEMYGQAPKIPAVQGVQTLTGYAKIPQKNLFALSAKVDSKQAWPRFITQLDIEQLSQLLDVELYPFILLLKPEQRHGFQRDWYPVVGKPAKHIGYAVQWFSLAGLLVIIYLVVNIKRKES